MVSTPPSLLRERVNAKHTGGVSKQSCLPLHCWTVDLPQGQKHMCVPLLLLRGLRCAEQSSGSLAEALLSTGGLLSSPWVLIAELLPTPPSPSLC